MKSWAVTRGPSLVPGEKRLAVQVEDHPIDYNKFEGTIPKGEYGGGTVMIWDRGTWQPEARPAQGPRQGPSRLRAQRRETAGGWHLVRMHRRPGEKRDNWLLIKQHDDAARTAKQKDILEQKPLSVADRPHHGRDRQPVAQRVWHSRPKGTSAPDEPEKKPPQAPSRQPKRPASGRKPLPHDLCAKPANRLTTRASGRAKRRPARVHRALPRDAGRQGADKRQLDPRDQVRRLPPAGAARPRQGQAAHPQGTRLDGEISDHRDGVARLPAGRALIDGELVVGRRRRHFALFIAAAGPEGRRATTAWCFMLST